MTKKTWRPEGLKWYNPYEPASEKYMVFEQGADAMIAVLRTMWGDRYSYRGEHGKVVHIPDDPPEEPTPKEAKPLLDHSLDYAWNKLLKQSVRLGCLEPDHPAIRQALMKTDKVHPATKIIEKGYFCDKCGARVPYMNNLGITQYHYCWELRGIIA